MKRNRAVPRRFSVAIVLAIFLAMAFLATGAASLGHVGHVSAYAQQQPPTGQQPRSREQQSEPDLRVSVRLVNVFTTVTDSHGAPIANLQKDDFKVTEDGLPQSVRVFDRESALPLSIVMEVDTSPSTERDFKLEVVSAKRFARQIMRPVDRLAVYQVTEHVDQLTPFTPDLRRI